MKKTCNKGKGIAVESKNGRKRIGKQNGKGLLRH